MTRCVLVTRPQPGAALTAARLIALGYDPILAPMLEVQTLTPPLPAPAGVQAILLTSANAIAPLPAVFHDTPVLAVGTATAHQARAHGFSHVQSADGDARDLAALVHARCARGGLPLLLASGAGQGHALATALTGDGYAVQRIEVYRATAVAALPAAAEHAWRAGTCGAAMFYSAESAHAFVRLIRAAALTDGACCIAALAISAATAAALAPLPWAQVRVAVRPDQETMLALLP